MNIQLSIETLLQQGVSNRKIVKLLGVDKKSVNRAIQALQKGPNPPTGPASNCEPYRELIEAKLEMGRHIKSIHYDLVHEHGAKISYDSLKRFVRTLAQKTPEVVARLSIPLGKAA